MFGIIKLISEKHRIKWCRGSAVVDYAVILFFVALVAIIAITSVEGKGRGIYNSVTLNISQFESLNNQ